MENQNPRVPPLREHSLTTLLGHDPTSDPGIALRQWVHFQGVHNILDLLIWDQEEVKAVPAQQVYSLDDPGQGLYLRTNQIKQIYGLITYIKHVFAAYNSDIDPRDDPFHPFTPDEWSQQTSTMLRTYLIQNLPHPHGPEPVPSGPISSSRPTGYSPAAIELMGFKKGIKREIAAYPFLKDERYFDGFKRCLFIVAKTHKCNDVLEPTYTPGSEPEEQELFEEQTFMFSVFNANLQTDMGKTIVRRHLANTDAQSVWKQLSEHMRTSSQGASEKRRLTQYVTSTVLDDNFKGTTEQFVLHFNEQFRQLEEISEDSEKIPPTVKLTLLQTAVRSINDLRIVETLDEFQETTYGHGSFTSLSYETYYDLLINACVRYDKTRRANIGKRRNVYNTNIDDTYVDHPTACIDHVPNSPYGGIDLTPDAFCQLHTLSSRHPHSLRPGNPSRPSFRPQSQMSGPTKPIRRYDGPIFLPPQIFKLLIQDAMKTYNTEAISRFHQRKVHNTEIVETPQNDPPGPPVPENDLPDLPGSDLDIPYDPNLDFVNSQCHSSEDLDQALQVYQAYQVPCLQDSTMTPERTINHHFTYHVAQASQAKHGSLVDRGANGGLAGSDVRILSRSSRNVLSLELTVMGSRALMWSNVQP